MATKKKRARGIGLPLILIGLGAIAIIVVKLWWVDLFGLAMVLGGMEYHEGKLRELV